MGTAFNQSTPTGNRSINKSLAIHESWQSYQGLGWALGNTHQYQRAIEAFNKSLAIHESWQSYQGLGWALHSTNQHQQAIEAFNKSCYSWQSYQGLGWALGNTHQYQESHECIIASIKLLFYTDRTDSWSSGKEYSHLATALNNLERAQPAKRAYQIYLRQSHDYPHKLVDPLLGMKDGITTTRDFIDKISDDLNNFGYSFHPSFLSCTTKDIYQLQSWRHLIHIHIPKCAGTNFIEPFVLLMRKCIEFHQKSERHLNTESKHYLWHGNLGEKYKHDAYLLEMLQGKALTD